MYQVVNQWKRNIINMVIKIQNYFFKFYRLADNVSPRHRAHKYLNILNEKLFSSIKVILHLN